jgi:peptidoglycan/LPS O-acetylase OafA/YrhL
MSSLSPNARLAFVDGLRGLAASMVVVDHFYGRVAGDLALPAPLAWICLHGSLGVAIFFVLSGFVISMCVGNHAVSGRFLGRFAARRAVRLDPPYWTSLALALGLAALSARMFAIPKTFPSSGALAAHLVYLQNVLGFGDYIAVYWTLCLEVQFYLFLLVMLWGLQWAYRRDSAAILGRPGSQAVVGGLAVLSVLQFTDLVDVVPDGLFLPYWFCFTLGAVTFWVGQGWMRRRFLAAALAIVAAGGIVFGNPWCLTAVATAATLHAAARAGRMQRWLANRPMQFLGRISYSLYLFHAIVGWTAMSFALRFLPEPRAAWSAAGAAVFGAACSVLSAWVVYRVVEHQSVKLSHRISLAVPAR